MLAGLTLSFGGWQLLKELRFALLVLLLAIPLPAIFFNQITFPLQILASKLASDLLPCFGVPVLREGNVIQLPLMKLEVAEACSGIRSLMSLFTLAVFYGYFMEKSNRRRVVIVLASIPIAIAANAVRILGTGLCVQYWDPDKAMGFFHEFSGWVIFLVSLTCLYTCSSRDEPDSDQKAAGMKSLRFWMVVLLLAGTALLLAPARPCGSKSAQRASGAISLSFGRMDGKRSADRSGDARRPRSRRLSLPQLFRDKHQPPINLFIGYFPSQRTGQTIHSPKNCLPGAGWVFESSGAVDLTDTAGKPHRVGEYIISNGEARQFVLYWYQAHGRSVASEYMAKIYMVADAIRLNRTDGALVRVITPIAPGEDTAAARERAEAYTRQLAPLLPRFIPD